MYVPYVAHGALESGPWGSQWVGKFSGGGTVAALPFLPASTVLSPMGYKPHGAGWTVFSPRIYYTILENSSIDP